MHSYVSYDTLFLKKKRKKKCVYVCLRMHSYISYDTLFLCHPARKRVTPKGGPRSDTVCVCCSFLRVHMSWVHIKTRLHTWYVNVCQLYKYVLLYIISTYMFSHTHTGCMSPLQICSPLQKCSPTRQIYKYVSSHTHTWCNAHHHHYKYVLAYVYSTKMFSRTSALCMCVDIHIHVNTLWLTKL